MALSIYAIVELRGELYNYPNLEDNRQFLIQGSSVVGDISEEVWTFVNASTALDNGITVIRPTETPPTNPGRWVLKRKIARQYGTTFSKEWRGSLTVSGNTATFDISGAGFTNIVDWNVKCYLPGATITNFPFGILTSKSNTSITITLVESKTTNTLLLSTAEGLELHAVAGTEVYLTVYGN